MSIRLHKLQRDVDAWLVELEPVLKDYETKKSDFDRMLADLDKKQVGV